MQKKNLLTRLLLLFALVAGGGGTNVWAEEATISYSGSTSNMDGTNQAALFGLNQEEWSVIGNKGGHSLNVGLNSGGEIRIYWNTNGSNTFEVKSLINATINSIEIIYVSDNKTDYTKGKVLVNNNEVEANNGVYLINANSFIITNGNTSNVQVRFTSVKINYTSTITPAFEVTAKSNNESYGTVELSGSTIKATPNDGYRVSKNNPYTVTPAGSAEVTQDGNVFTVAPTANCTVTINFEAIPKHTASFSINGVVSTEEFAEDAEITFPSVPEQLGGKSFVGWVETPIEGTTSEQPELTTTTVMGTDDITFYALFVAKEVGEDVTDDITREITGVSAGASNYDSWNDKTSNSEAIYAGNSAGGNNATSKDAIQLRTTNNNSGIVSTTSGGKLKKVVVNWADGNYSGTTIDVYGSNVAYIAASDLYNNEKQGTKVGSIKKGESEELNIEGDYIYIGIRSSNNALCINKIEITWGAVSYSDYCTTVTAPITITDAEYATFAADYAIDLSETDIKAYTAQDKESYVSLTEIEGGKVPANTPVVLYKKGAGGSMINVPVIADVNLVVGDNDLKVSTGEDVDNMYVLANKESGVGFYKWAGTTALSEGKVYLQGKTAGARDFLGFDNETTGINTTLMNNEAKNKEFYNLAGQRVAQPTKGLYVVNGEKVIIK